MPDLDFHHLSVAAQINTSKLPDCLSQDLLVKIEAHNEDVLDVADIDDRRDQLRAFDASGIIGDDIAARQTALMTVTTAGLYEAITAFERGVALMDSVLEQTMDSVEQQQQELAAVENKAGKALDSIGFTERACQDLPYNHGVLLHQCPLVRSVRQPLEKLTAKIAALAVIRDTLQGHADDTRDRLSEYASSQLQTA